MAEGRGRADVFRRSVRLKAVPLAVLVVVAVGVAAPRLVVPAGVVGFYFLVSAVVGYGFRLEITPERLIMRGYLGGPVEIAKDSVNVCRYHTYRVKGRGSVEMFFLEILGLPGGALRVWRYGWGSQRHRLFPMLAEWLDEAHVALGDAERSFLAAAG